MMLGHWFRNGLKPGRSKHFLATEQEFWQLVKEEASDDSETLMIKAEKILEAARNDRPGGETISPIAEVVPRVIHNLEQAHQNQGLAGISTGLWALDAILGGFQSSDLIILAGRPGTGKTSLGMHFATHAARQDHRCLVFSVEMSEEQLVTRMLATQSRIPAHRLRTGKIYGQDIEVGLIDHVR